MSFFLFYTSYQIMRSNNSIFTNRFLFETNQRKLPEVASSNVTSSTLKFNETAEISVYVISLSSPLLVRKSPICSYLIRKILPVSFVNKESRPFFTTTPTQPLMSTESRGQLVVISKDNENSKTLLHQKVTRVPTSLYSWRLFERSRK